ncbi:MAG: tRNA threonylcarbamoyladenosine biosynthesis protein TsaE [Bacteroidetes bacterium ADurb.Bin302]|nr:MAG: tRNA threonylcarbamoyladenosine biosynthesis protein TsaE [Bacteroidetes bacterium ADurb.Bin302]
MNKLLIKDLDSLHSVAKDFLKLIGDSKIIAFYGAMGAGKTTFIKALCDVLGVQDTVNSPTFAIVNEYTDDEGNPIYHFDCYRIKKIEEAYDLGYDQYFFSGNYCFIEWPEMLEELLPEDTKKVNITEREDGGRDVLFD